MTFNAEVRVQLKSKEEAAKLQTGYAKNPILEDSGADIKEFVTEEEYLKQEGKGIVGCQHQTIFILPMELSIFTGFQFFLLLS